MYIIIWGTHLLWKTLYISPTFSNNCIIILAYCIFILREENILFCLTLYWNFCTWKHQNVWPKTILRIWLSLFILFVHILQNEPNNKLYLFGSAFYNQPWFQCVFCNIDISRSLPLYNRLASWLKKCETGLRRQATIPVNFWTSFPCDV